MMSVSKLDFALFSLKLFDDVVLANQAYVDLIVSDAFTHETYYMGTVDEKNLINFYDGMIRVTGPNGKEFVQYPAKDYPQHIAERVEPWSYLKFPYLKNIGWKGFLDGKDSGVFRVAPLARLNAADGMATPLAQEAYEQKVVKQMNRFFDLLLVHSDPAFQSLHDSFSTLGDIQAELVYTGYVAPQIRQESAAPSKTIIASIGGGRFGHELAEAVVRSAPLLARSITQNILLYTGPFCPQDIADQLHDLPVMKSLLANRLLLHLQ